VASQVASALTAAGTLCAAIVGRVTGTGTGRIRVTAD